MPATLRVALGLIWVQLIALILVLLLFVYRVVQMPSPLGFYVTAFGLGILVALYVALRLLHRRRLSGRGAALAMQLLFLAPVYYMIAGGLWYGWMLAAWIVAVTVFLFVPTTGRALSS